MYFLVSKYDELLFKVKLANHLYDFEYTKEEKEKLIKKK